jgi:hypothetical protein
MCNCKNKQKPIVQNNGTGTENTGTQTGINNSTEDKK